jgi:hypothetical protein
MLERDVQERCTGLGEYLIIAVDQLSVDMGPAAAGVRHPGAHDKLTVDRHRPAVADEDARGDGGEAVPGGEEPARLVERCGDETAVNQPGPCLVALVEAEARLVTLGALLGRKRKANAVRIVAAAPAGWVMVRRDPAQRSPPCWKCALKKFSDPAVAMAAEAEISSPSVAAATIWAKR